ISAEQSRQAKAWVDPERGQEWIVTVQDNGIGIPRQYHEQVFGLFKRLHGREVPGSGIGLAICRKIVERHGGSIAATSTTGQGATFIVTLPVTQAAAEYVP
ncbi:MAG TPA: ATP-binding protein, partial [Gemmatimonadaceae bacterium]|nr:ATP-binding protein [Gemmatimonadaceae bacterium]